MNGRVEPQEPDSQETRQDRRLDDDDSRGPAASALIERRETDRWFDSDGPAGDVS
jgi:hypothetical protein